MSFIYSALLKLEIFVKAAVKTIQWNLLRQTAAKVRKFSDISGTDSFPIFTTSPWNVGEFFLYLDKAVCLRRCYWFWPLCSWIIRLLLQ